MGTSGSRVQQFVDQIVDRDQVRVNCDGWELSSGGPYASPVLVAVVVEVIKVEALRGLG